MSRSNYTEEESYPGQFALWRGRVMSAIRGKRGQLLLRELAESMDAMPEKVLIAQELRAADGGYCALGVVGEKRGIDLDSIDPEDPRAVSKAFNIAECMAMEIAYVNDEDGCYSETPEKRWQRVREWVTEHLSVPTSTDGAAR